MFFFLFSNLCTHVHSVQCKHDTPFLIHDEQSRLQLAFLFFRFNWFYPFSLLVAHFVTALIRIKTLADLATTEAILTASNMSSKVIDFSRGYK
jgi:hypothetical protein